MGLGFRVSGSGGLGPSGVQKSGVGVYKVESTARTKNQQENMKSSFHEQNTPTR